MSPRAWPALALMCLLPQAHAARVVSVHVRRSGAHFLIRMRITLDAPPPAVFQALEDYAALPRYEPDVRALRSEPTREPDRVRLFMTLHGCVLFFCKTMRQEQIMTATADGDGGVVRSELLPQGSDFRHGRGLWRVAPCPSGSPASCLSVRIEVVPTFWVPPVIGPWLIRRKLREQAHRASLGLEQIARSHVLRQAPLKSARRHLRAIDPSTPTPISSPAHAPRAAPRRSRPKPGG